MMMTRWWWTRRRLGALAAGAAVLVLSVSVARGCPFRQPPMHLNPNMDDQAKYRPQEASPFFASGAASQLPVESTIARGALREDTAFYSGRSLFGSYVSNPLPVDAALVDRGRERYGIYCTPCHGPLGDGRGPLYERAKLESRDLHEDRVRQMPDGRLFDVITNGSGLMPGYRFPIPVHDRWAIVAYLRELQAEGPPPGGRP